MANFTGGSGDDIFTGGSENDTLISNGGNDTLSGGGGNDRLVGGAGEDFLDGGDGDDQLFSHIVDPNFNTYGSRGVSLDIYAEVDVLNGGAGDDYIFAGYGDFVDGGTYSFQGDRLFISFLGAPSGVQADFRVLQGGGTLTIGGATIKNIPTSTAMAPTTSCGATTSTARSPTGSRRRRAVSRPTMPCRPMSRPTGRSLVPATSTATGSATCCGATPAAR